TEGQTAVFSVTVTNAGAGSTVSLALADGTAIDADYHEAFFEYSTDGGTTWQAVSGPIAVGAGDSALLVRTDTVDDLLDENNETFTLTGTLSSLGDTYSDTATATIIDNDVVPTINPSALAVSEEGLPGGLADLVGMDDTTNLAVRSGSIDYSSNGAAALTVALLTDGLPGSLGSTAIVWSHEGGNEAIVVGRSGGGEDLIRIVLNGGTQVVDTNSPSIAYSVELLKPLEHLGVNVEDDLSFDIDVRLSDGANSAQTAALTITVEDDSPLEAGTDAVVLNIPPVSFDGQLAFIGADTGGASGTQWTTSLSTLNGLGLTSGGRAVVFSHEDGQTLLVAETTEGEPVFTVRANADGTYSFNSLAPLDLSSLNLDDATVSSGGGPKSTYYWYDDGSLTNVLDASKDLVVSITGYKNGALADVNPSGAGIGIQNNEFDDGERLVFDFDAAGSDGEANLAYAVRFELFQYGAGDSFQVTGTYQDGSAHVGGYSIESVGGDTYLVITAESGKYFDTLEVAMSDGKVKIQGLETYVLEDAPPQLVELTFTAEDADGDQVDGDIVLTFQNQPDTEGGIVGNAMFGGAEPDAEADSEVFVWSLGDQGTADSPAIDRVDFDVEDGDVLDLRDLLPDDAGDSLSSYLSFGSMEGKLALLVDHDGGGAFETTQAIVFENYASTAELASALELDAGWTEADILNRMIADGQLKS
ncbi:type I secretion C-terminal target domain-containing protein, partial [Thauera chlorobenzoica]